MNQNVILYHKGCPDGFGSAWSAWKKFDNKAQYIAVKHGENHPKNLRGKDVYILDFCYPATETKKILRIAKSVTIIDHHFSRKSATKLAPNNVYSEKNSGAVLSWKYFHPKKPLPKILRYIEDIDLWKKRLPHTDELSMSLWSYAKDFKIWNKIAKDWETSRGQKKYVEEGKIIRKINNQTVEHAVRNAQLAIFLGHKAVVSNSHVLASDIADAIIKKAKVHVAIVWYEQDNCIKVRLNSDGKVDVSKLAEKFGDGGGHKASSAFRLKLSKKLPWKVISGKIA